MSGIVAAAAYLPHFRLADTDIPVGPQLRSEASRMRSVASFDEDTTTMAVEAGRRLLSLRPEAATVHSLLLATTSPAYADKTNATAVHAALGLSRDMAVMDVGGGMRAGAAALRSGLSSPGISLVCLSDMRSGLPGSSDERTGGDASAALLVAGGGEDVPLAAELIATGAATAEFLDRWAAPGSPTSDTWEETFGETVYAELGESALADALKNCGLVVGDVGRLIVVGSNRRAVRRFRKGAGVAPTALADDLTQHVGNTGAAHLGLLLTAAIEECAEGAIVVAVSLSDGADAFVFRTVAPQQAGIRLSDCQAARTRMVDYATFLTWRGVLPSAGTRRPSPMPPVAPASYRASEWKFAFRGTVCRDCGHRHVPPQRVCLRCQSVDRMEGKVESPVAGVVANSTIDRLAWTPYPPAVYAIVDLDGGGRCQLDVTDVGADELPVGSRVRLTFRKRYTRDGIHNYFWKFRPEREDD